MGVSDNNKGIKGLINTPHPRLMRNLPGMAADKGESISTDAGVNLSEVAKEAQRSLKNLGQRKRRKPKPPKNLPKLPDFLSTTFAISTTGGAPSAKDKLFRRLEQISDLLFVVKRDKSTKDGGNLVMQLTRIQEKIANCLNDEHLADESPAIEGLLNDADLHTLLNQHADKIKEILRVRQAIASLYKPHIELAKIINQNTTDFNKDFNQYITESVKVLPNAEWKEPLAAYDAWKNFSESDTLKNHLDFADAAERVQTSKNILIFIKKIITALQSAEFNTLCTNLTALAKHTENVQEALVEQPLARLNESNETNTSDSIQARAVTLRTLRMFIPKTYEQLKEIYKLANQARIGIHQSKLVETITTDIPRKFKPLVIWEGQEKYKLFFVNQNDKTNREEITHTDFIRKSEYPEKIKITFWQSLNNLWHFHSATLPTELKNKYKSINEQKIQEENRAKNEFEKFIGHFDDKQTGEILDAKMLQVINQISTAKQSKCTKMYDELYVSIATMQEHNSVYSKNLGETKDEEENPALQKKPAPLNLNSPITKMYEPATPKTPANTNLKKLRDAQKNIGTEQPFEEMAKLAQQISKIANHYDKLYREKEALVPQNGTPNKKDQPRITELKTEMVTVYKELAIARGKFHQELEKIRRRNDAYKYKTQTQAAGLFLSTITTIATSVHYMESISFLEALFMSSQIAAASSLTVLGLMIVMSHWYKRHLKRPDFAKAETTLATGDTINNLVDSFIENPTASTKMASMIPTR